MDLERVRKELQAAALREFPNPERVGCPEPGVLDDMSRRKVEMTQAQLHHVTHCSPCFQTFLSIREEIRKRQAVRFRIAAAAGAAVIAVGAIVYTGLTVRSTAPRERVLATSATLDLRLLSENRGADSSRASEAKPALILPRKNLRLTLYFPAGADEGQYTLQLLDGQMRTLLKQHLSASLHNHVVTASAELDFDPFPGVIRLPLRRLAAAHVFCFAAIEPQHFRDVHCPLQPVYRNRRASLRRRRLRRIWRDSSIFSGSCYSRRSRRP